MDHNKIITAAAKHALAPLGLRRHGKSRVWYDDHGWWSIVIEFQPSSWARGTYLNVGVCWHVYEKAHWSFDVGYREQPFSEARTDHQFSDAASDIADHARKCVESYRSRFSSIADAHRHYQSTAPKQDWGFYHAGVIAGLCGDISVARTRFDDLLSLPKQHQWQHGLHYRALDLSRLLDNRVYFFDSVLGIVLRTRSQLGLDPSNLPHCGLPTPIVA
jgi:hypothetical protein